MTTTRAPRTATGAAGAAPDERRAAPGGVSFRPLTRADIPAGLSLGRAAGWNQTEADWNLLVELGGARGCAALVDGAVVGTLTSVVYEGCFAWIGMVLVDAAMRGRGIGRALLDRALGQLGDLPARLDATPQGHPLYLRLGFVEECRLTRMTSATRGVGSSQAEGPRPMRGPDLDGVGAWDEAVFGADRRRLLRWAREVAPDRALVLEQQGRMRGYCFGRRGRLFDQVGPLVADSLDTARRLVAASRLQASGRPLVADVPAASRDWVQALADLGFVEQRPFVRMCLGRNDHPGRPHEQLAIFGPEWG